MKHKKTLATLLVSAFLLSGATAAHAAPEAAAPLAPSSGPVEGGTAVELNVERATDEIVSASGGRGFSALLANGKVLSWGDNGSGQAGVGNMEPLPTDQRSYAVFPEGVKVAQLKNTGTTSLALDTDGHLWVWGENSAGEVGLGMGIPGPTQPQMIPVTGDPTFVSIEFVGQTGYAITDDGKLYGWGVTKGAWAGNTKAWVPTVIPFPTTSPVTKVSASSTHALASTADGKVYGWGDSSYGQVLGSPSVSVVYTPKLVPMAEGAPAGAEWTGDIVVGNNFSYAKANDGKWYSRGNNEGNLSGGYLGSSCATTQCQLLGYPIEFPEGADIIAVEPGMALDAAGHVYTWGMGTSGRLGNGTTSGKQMTPMLVDGLPPIKKIWTAVGASPLALSEDNQLWGWGTQQVDGAFVFPSKPMLLADYDAPLITGVDFDGEAATITAAATRSATVTVPAHAAGAVDVKVTWSDGFTTTLPGAYTYVAKVVQIAPSITTTSIASAQVSKAYSAQIAATGTPTPTLSITKGALPTGLTMDKGGKITGTTKQKGTFTFTVTAANEVKPDAVKSFTLVVVGQPVIDPPKPPVVKPAVCAEPRKVAVFADAPLSHKFYKAIDWMECMKYSTGWKQSAGKPLYKPADNLQRQAMAAFIFRMEADKNYQAPKVSPFADVQPGDKFYREIAWMWDQKLSTGYQEAGGKPTYRPTDSLSREAMAAFIYRLEASKDAKVKAYQAPKASMLADMKPGAKFYKEISWMYDTKLSTGNKVGNTKEYWPKADLSRQAMAAFIYRLVTDYRAKK